MIGLTFRAFRDANVARCEAVWHPIHGWDPLQWAGALAGEVGEAANLAKKWVRQAPGDPTIDELRAALAKELGDVQAYLDLLAARCGIDLGAATAEKWDEVSRRVGHPVRLAEETVRDSFDGKWTWSESDERWPRTEGWATKEEAIANPLYRRPES